MKAEKAKNKWCPMARYAFGGSPGYASGNRFDVESLTGRNYYAQCLCLGPDCMAWTGDETTGECGLVFHGSRIDVTSFS